MVNRSKSSVDPPVAHFRTADHAGELAEDGPDYLAKANLYRRKVVQTGESGGERVRSGSRFFVGARSGFLLGYNDGLVTVARSADDISADGVDGVVVTYVQSGQFRLVADGRDETFEPGDLVVEDTRRPRRSTVGFLRTGTLFIPRHRFNEAIDVPSEQLTLLRGLSRAPLAPTLTQQIRFLMQSLDTLSPNEFEAALDAAIDVALVMLRKQAARERPVEDHILKTAKTFIEANFRNVELTPNTIARAVGCSRAVLYRSFADAEITVAAYLRDLRFRHFLESLRAQPEAQISQLSYDSGFDAEPSDFAKLFKRAYGVTPREARQRLLE